MGGKIRLGITFVICILVIILASIVIQWRNEDAIQREKQNIDTAYCLSIIALIAACLGLASVLFAVCCELKVPYVSVLCQKLEGGKPSSIKNWFNIKSRNQHSSSQHNSNQYNTRHFNSNGNGQGRQNINE